VKKWWMASARTVALDDQSGQGLTDFRKRVSLPSIGFMAIWQLLQDSISLTYFGVARTNGTLQQGIGVTGITHSLKSR
jgi:hypothetical protein